MGKLYLGDESSSRSQELCCQLHGVDDEGVLAGGLLRPSASDVRRAVVEDQVERRAAIVAHNPLHLGLALGLGDVLLDCDGAAYRGDRDEVDADDKGANGDALDGDLHPAARGGAEVEDGVGGAEESKLGVELDQLP